MGYLNQVIKHRKDSTKNQVYDSYFDEQKRNLHFKGKIKVKPDLSIDQVYQRLVSILTKDLVDFDLKADIILTKKYVSKKNSKIVTQILDYEVNEFLTFAVDSGKISNFITYSLTKQKKDLLIKIHQVTVYPYLIFGSKGAQLKWENKQKFKNFVDLLTQKINH